MKEIVLTKGKVALVDDADFERLNAFRWGAHEARQGQFYARRVGKHRVYMHREIMGAGLGEITDHRDRDGLNNQRSNLRLATPSQNMWNQSIRKSNRTGFKGVHYIKRLQIFTYQITCKGKVYSGRHFQDALSAARAYDLKARELHGEFAYQNFPDETN